MANMIGMDPQEVQAQANALAAQAQKLDSLVHSIDAAMRNARAYWNGAHLDDFQRRWLSVTRPRLQEAHTQMVELARSARENAEQQLRASGDGNGSPTMSPGNGNFDSPAQWISSASTVVGSANVFTTTFSKNAWNTGRYTKSYTKLLEATGWPELLKYKKSTVFHWLNGHQKFVQGFDRTATVLGAISAAYEIDAGLRDNDPHILMHGLTSEIDLFVGKSLPGKLMTLNVHLWNDVGYEAGKADWGYMPQTLDYASKNLNVVAEEIGKAAVDVIGRVWGWVI